MMLEKLIMPLQNRFPNDVLTLILQSLGSFSLEPTVEHTPREFRSRLSENDTKEAKNLFLTLHFLFPHELLPALDLIDRGLIMQYQSARGNAIEEGPERLCAKDITTGHPAFAQDVYYVQSASAGTHQSLETARSRKALQYPSPSYQVRLDSWNCSCPAFAYSAFSKPAACQQGTTGIASARTQAPDYADKGRYSSTNFGGSMVCHGSSTPICKHILAAVLARSAPRLFADGVQIKEISLFEVAGWAAGWGDH